MRGEVEEVCRNEEAELAGIQLVVGVVGIKQHWKRLAEEVKVQVVSALTFQEIALRGLALTRTLKGTACLHIQHDAPRHFFALQVGECRPV